MKTSPRRPGWLWLLLVLGVLGGCYGVIGYVMAASLGAADAPGSPSRSGAAAAYLAITAISAILAVAAGVALLRRRIARPAATEAARLDGTALSTLEEAGADLSQPTEVSFYLYVPTEAAAGEAVDELRRIGFAAEVRPPLEGYAEWLCLATREMVPSPGAIQTERRRFEELAARLDAEFDGWEAEVRR